MTYPQVADGGTASNMEDSWVYGSVQPRRGVPLASGLDGVLKTPHHKKVPFYETFTLALDLDLSFGSGSE